MPLISLFGRTGSRLPAHADFRGWAFATLVDRATVGRVDDVLIDDGSGNRFLEVNLGRLHGHVLVPVDHVRVDPDRRTVWMPGFNRRQARAIPPFHRPARGDLRPDRPARQTRILRSRRRPIFGGTVYGASELEERLRPSPSAGLVPLSRLRGFRVPPGEPDPRGWTVVDPAGVPLGRAVDLLVDPVAHKVRAIAWQCTGKTTPGRGHPPARFHGPLRSVEIDRERSILRIPAPPLSGPGAR